jgi:hypothetical protein
VSARHLFSLIPSFDYKRHSSLVYAGKLPPTIVEHEHNEKLRNMYSKFHRIPRICFYALTKGATDAYLQEIQSAINNIGSIETFIHSTSGPMPFPDKTSSKLVRIEPVDHAWRTTSTMLLSDYITKRILERISLYRMINASQSIKNLLSDPNSRGHGGKLFEQAVHRKFCAGFQFFPDKLTLDAPQLEINIIGFDNEADGYFHCLEVRSAKGSRAINKYVQRYLVPISKTKESVDSVWLSTGCTVFFQVTVNPDHGLKGHGITELVDEPPGDAKKNVYVVFVVPLDGERTKSFKHQKITFPTGTPQAKINLVEGYHQYLYFFDLDCLAPSKSK